MNRRDIVIGIIVIILLGGLVYWRQRNQPTEELKVPETLSVEQKLEEKFGVTIPEDVDKAELTDQTGGNASALATRKFEDGQFTFSLLADLPDPETGTYYQTWVEKGDTDVSLGRLSLAKGGWMLDYKGTTDYSDYNTVLVTVQKTADNAPEEIILKGSF